MGAARVALALLAMGCKADDTVHVECARVCAHVVEVMTGNCIYNCGDARAAATADCLNRDCPSWTPPQVDCIMKARDVEGVGSCPFQRK
jgi:hypothetical protein